MAMDEKQSPTGCVPLDSSISMDLDASFDFRPGYKSVKGKRHPRETVEFLKKWLYDHRENPFPSPQEKAELVQKTKLTHDQIERWFNHSRGILNRMMIEYYVHFRDQPRTSSSVKKTDVKKKSMLCKKGSELEDLTITRDVFEAFLQNNYMKRKPFPKESEAILRKWLEDNPGKSLPTEAEKIKLAKEAKLEYNRVSKWFYNVHDRSVNAKKRKEKYAAKSENKPLQKAEIPTDILRKWFYEHRNNPYPTTEEVEQLARQTNMNEFRVRNWMSTFRFRHNPETIGRRKNHFRENKNPTAFTDSAMHTKALKKPMQKTRGTQTEEFSSMPQSSEAKMSGIQILGMVCSDILQSSEAKMSGIQILGMVCSDILQSSEAKMSGIQILGMVCSEILLGLNGGESTDPSSGSESCSSKM